MRAHDTARRLYGETGARTVRDYIAFRHPRGAPLQPGKHL